MMMNRNEIPKVIASYLHAQNEFNVDTLLGCFLSDAQVFDEGKTYCGHDAIREWNLETNAKYQTQMQPLELSINGNIYNLKIRMSGIFPGSPLDAIFLFKVENEKIATLTIN